MPRGKFSSTNQKRYPNLVSATSSDGIFALVPRTSFRWEPSGGISGEQSWRKQEQELNMEEETIGVNEI